MPSERVQRQIDRLLDEAEAAAGTGQWSQLSELANRVLTLDPENADAISLVAIAERGLTGGAPSGSEPLAPASVASPSPDPSPTSFGNGRYSVRKFLGEGGKKRVYLAHDALLDRDVAFALIKTEGLDEASRTRITREAQAMGRLGDHPNIVTVYDIGEENGAPYMVLPVLGGGDVEGVIEKAPEHRMPLEQALKIAIETCKGLEFAHGRGIVHRDLKPGNVWLSDDGTAKIGDFGLAVATDRSRLTQAGMMVGTVSYMPPEQAMGGEVGPHSDLYSLGAMLYEMVCGRPPFVGDESVAIIGQHLNTPPVAPTWHRPDCPPALETLILRLLEKDPSKRPASATEVREALESVSAGREPASRDPSIATEPPATGDNPLYRRTFVGRESEVRQLQQAFDAALSGEGGLVMVVGEPGIGKTALCEQLATYVALRGGKALVGHCYEEGSLSLPYLAFVEAMRSYVLAREPDGLRSDLGTGAADVARIVSEVRDRVQGVELRPPGDPEDDRWRLLQAVTSFLRNASTVQPLCIVLEDLHWADRGTLDLLLHMARNLQGARLLIVGTYRDVEVDRSHPLSGALAELGRVASFQRVRLRGLTIDEVQRMMAGVAQREVPVAFAELIHRQTEGNPLFIQEMLRYLVEEGLVSENNGALRRVGEEPLAGRIPEGLRDVIGKRLSRLSIECNRLLAIAAIIGRDFRLDTLRTVAGAEENALVTALEEATRIGVLEEQARTGVITYRFTHAFFRQTLYEELSAPRRLSFHQQVARALEAQYATRRLEHAAELAEHFANSTDRADLSKAVEYGELAAQRAVSVFDYGEASRLLDRALDAQEVFDPDDRAKRCDLLLALGMTRMRAGEPLRVAEEIAESAFNESELLADPDRASRSCQLALLSLNRYGAGTMTGTTVFRRWVERADLYAQPDSLARVYADRGLSGLNIAQGRYRQAHEFAKRSVDLARRLNEPEALFSAVWLYLNMGWGPEDESYRFELAREFMAWPTEGVSLETQSALLRECSSRFLEMGDRAGAEALWSRVQEIATRSQDARTLLDQDVFEARRATLDGRLEDAVAAAEHLVTLSEALGSPIYGLQFHVIAAYTPLVYLGRAEEALAATGRAERTVGAAGGWSGGGRFHRPGLLARLGREHEARALLHELLTVLDIAGGAPVRLSHLGQMLDAAVVLKDHEALTILASRLKIAAHILIWMGAICTARLLGDAGVVLGKPDEARAYYDQALEVCQKVRFRPEMALTRLALAELLLNHYPDEHDAAIEHLDFAIAELRDMKMQPALERALRHRGLLKA